jgi:Cys-tRNA(Pro)/Cys-tRNA(Cys) deacylase
VTPAVEAAKRAGVEFTLHEYEGVDVGDGDYAVGVAAALGRPAAQLFKTLVVSVDGDLRVFVVPADRQLDLRSVGKRAQMADRQQAERATGYVAGGISPRRALQIEQPPQDLVALTDAKLSNLVHQR